MFEKTIEWQQRISTTIAEIPDRGQKILTNTEK